MPWKSDLQFHVFGICGSSAVVYLQIEDFENYFQARTETLT